MGRAINSIVFAPHFRAGGVKSLYGVCEWLNEPGRSTIAPFVEPKLISWFEHRCELYDYSYSPEVMVYPEVYQLKHPETAQQLRQQYVDKVIEHDKE